MRANDTCAFGLLAVNVLETVPSGFVVGHGAVRRMCRPSFPAVPELFCRIFIAMPLELAVHTGP
jgi:hypothetical protein